MKFKRTLIFAFAFILFAAGVYFLDYRKDEKSEQDKEIDLQILKFDREQINMLEISKKGEKIVLQKSDKGWSLLEPIQDRADNEQIEELIKSISDERMIAVAKESAQLSEADLAEYGLDQPLATYIIKNNLGLTKKISIGTQKNFEGNSFLRTDSDNKVYVAASAWFTKAENKLIYYREKKLYRQPLADVVGVKVDSLRDSFEINRDANVWTSPQLEHVLDQNKVRETLRKIAESPIQDYVFDGEPSSALIAEKGLEKKPSVRVEFKTGDTSWSVLININENDNAVYALTDRPTRLVKLDPALWEFLGDLTSDSLRDRVSVTRFNLDTVSKVFVKYKGQEINLEKSQDKWKIKNTEDFSQNENFTHILNKVHDLQISEFLDKRNGANFKGTDMIILKSAEDNLVFQINWGPEFKMKKLGKEKDYFYSRTQISSSIFAIEKDKIEAIGLDKIFKRKDIAE